MRIELHILQNFSPSNLNRDDTGSPKECEFGGYRRARISSQSLKRAMRRQFEFAASPLIGSEHRASRTRLLIDLVATRLPDRDPENARVAALRLLKAAGIDADERGRTEYALFLGEQEIVAVAEYVDEHWEALTDGDLDAAASRETKADLANLLDGGRAASVALFGRMLADLPGQNIDAAAQVAHAISTNPLTIEFDYFTAVDDLLPEEDSGAAFLDVAEFDSACFYRYSNLDVEQLRANLLGDEDLVQGSMRAYLQGAITAIPGGKQNSMAAHNPPSLVFALVREAAPWSLANAFIAPVLPTAEEDIMLRSAQALARYWDGLAGMYGTDDVRQRSLATYLEADLGSLAEDRVDDVASLVEAVASAAS